jgi:hypothetical protein
MNKSVMQGLKAVAQLPDCFAVRVRNLGSRHAVGALQGQPGLNLMIKLPVAVSSLSTPTAWSNGAIATWAKACRA